MSLPLNGRTQYPLISSLSSVALALSLASGVALVTGCHPDDEVSAYDEALEESQDAQDLSLGELSNFVDLTTPPSTNLRYTAYGRGVTLSSRPLPKDAYTDLNSLLRVVRSADPATARQELYAQSDALLGQFDPNSPLNDVGSRFALRQAAVAQDGMACLARLSQKKKLTEAQIAQSCALASNILHLREGVPLLTQTSDEMAGECSLTVEEEIEILPALDEYASATLAEDPKDQALLDELKNTRSDSELLDQDAKTIDQAMKEANEKYDQAMAGALQNLTLGIVSSAASVVGGISQNDAGFDPQAGEGLMDPKLEGVALNVADAGESAALQPEPKDDCAAVSERAARRRARLKQLAEMRRHAAESRQERARQRLEEMRARHERRAERAHRRQERLRAMRQRARARAARLRELHRRATDCIKTKKC